MSEDATTEPFPVGTIVRYFGSQPNWHNRQLRVEAVPQEAYTRLWSEDPERGYALVPLDQHDINDYVWNVHRRNIALWDLWEDVND